MDVQLFAVTGSHGAVGRPPGTDLVVFRDLAAVVGPPAPGDSGDLAHYREVVECVFRRQGLLPAPPGTVFRGEDVVSQWLELHYFTLLDALGFVEEMVAARVDVVRSPGEDPAEGLDEAAETVLQDALRVLRRHAAATTTVLGDEERRPVAASFLVERDRWEGFEGRVAEESGRLPDFTLSLSGPWPPYDFVRMQFDS